MVRERNELAIAVVLEPTFDHVMQNVVVFKHTWYETAPEEACQESDTDVRETAVAPFAGDTLLNAPGTTEGGCTVSVKDVETVTGGVALSVTETLRM